LPVTPAAIAGVIFNALMNAHEIVEDEAERQRVARLALPCGLVVKI
jgi:hypothetical protein